MQRNFLAAIPLASCFLLALGFASFARIAPSREAPLSARVTLTDAETQKAPADIVRVWCFVRRDALGGEEWSGGSGIVVDRYEKDGRSIGIVLTNAHVVEGAHSGRVEFPNGLPKSGWTLCTFPDGSPAIDKDLDLAAIAVYLPDEVEGRPLSETIPAEGESLWASGYGGSGQGFRCVVLKNSRARANWGRVKGSHLVIRGSRARQGDSGGPVINEHGELAGVLNSTGPGVDSQGEILAVHCGLIRSFFGRVFGRAPCPNGRCQPSPRQDFPDADEPPAPPSPDNGATPGEPTPAEPSAPAGAACDCDGAACRADREKLQNLIAEVAALRKLADEVERRFGELPANDLDIDQLANQIAPKLPPITARVLDADGKEVDRAAVRLGGELNIYHRERIER